MKRSELLTLFSIFASMAAACFLPSIHQSQSYHHFANHTQYFGIPNFWNVISNLAFLLVGVAAFPLLKSDACHRILVAGIVLTAFGSAYYHAQPSDVRLLWDRLPMTVVFMCILTLTIGERISPTLATHLLWPLLLTGVLSVVYWRTTGDLRPYVWVQFYPLIAIPLMLCLRPGTARAQWAMIACYAVAKTLELFDTKLAIPAGAHAWKHVFAALGLLFYTLGWLPSRFTQR